MKSLHRLRFKCRIILRRMKYRLLGKFGSLVFHVSPSYGKSILAQWTGDRPSSLIDRIGLQFAMAWVLDQIYGMKTSVEKREYLKSLCMGGDAGLRWAKSYAEQGFPSPDTKHKPVFQWIPEVLAKADVTTFHQVACGSGREIGYYAKQFPNIEFVGSEMDEQVVNYLVEKWKDVTNLKFELRDLTVLDSEHCNVDTGRAIFASGGIQYLDPESTLRFFEYCRSNSHHLFLSQPLELGFSVDSERQSSPRGNLSWNHPYVHYLSISGWEEVRWEKTHSKSYGQDTHQSMISIYAHNKL